MTKSLATYFNPHHRSFKPKETISQSRGVYDLINENISDTEFLGALVQDFPEIVYLFDPHSKTTDNGWNRNASLAHQLYYGGYLPVNSFDPYKTDPTEFNRTANGLLILRWLIGRDTAENYQKFTQCQNMPIKKIDFLKLRNLVRTMLGISDIHSFDRKKSINEKTTAAACFVIMNDFGKCKNVIDAHVSLGSSANEDHDVVLAKVLERKPELFPSFASLNPVHGKAIRNASSIAFDVGHVLHFENAPVDLQEFSSLSKTARDLHLVHAICDIGGAQGHVNPNGSAVLNSVVGPVLIAALQELNAKDPQMALKSFAAIRAEMAGLPPPRTNEEKAKARMLGLARIYTQQARTHLEEAWKMLKDSDRETVIQEQNTSGLDGKPFIHLTYLPPTIDNGLRSLKRGWQGSAARNSLSDEFSMAQPKTVAIYETMRAMAKIYRAVRSQTENASDNGSITVNLNAFSAFARGRIHNIAECTTVKLHKNRQGQYSGHAEMSSPLTKPPGQSPNLCQ